MTWLSELAVRLVDRHHSQQIFRILGKPGLLSDLLVACPDLTHLVEVNKTMDKMILDSLNELAVRLTIDWKNKVRGCLETNVSLNSAWSSPGISGTFDGSSSIAFDFVALPVVSAAIPCRDDTMLSSLA